MFDNSKFVEYEDIITAEYIKALMEMVRAGKPISYEEAMYLAYKNTCKLVVEAELRAIEEFKNDTTLSYECKVNEKSIWLKDVQDRIKAIGESNTNPKYAEVSKEDKMEALEQIYSIKRALEAIEL